MHLIVTRSFPPEMGGMQNLMWGLANSISKYNLIKVFADYQENHKGFDKKVSFSIPLDKTSIGDFSRKENLFKISLIY